MLRGLPGKLMISVEPRIPATPRESIQLTVWPLDARRIASAIPGTSRSITARVASGVTSRGATPVPPVVSTSAAVDVAPLAQPLLDLCPLVGDDLTRRDLTADRARELLERGRRSRRNRQSGGPRRADREDRDAHQLVLFEAPVVRPPVFSSNVTCSIVTPRSSPLTMS
jgi:hypothetical protein